MCEGTAAFMESPQQLFVSKARICLMLESAKRVVMNFCTYESYVFPSVVAVPTNLDVPVLLSSRYSDNDGE